MTATDQLPAFDLCGALPEGVTVLEASAGTGKTYTIAALTARYVAEGTPLEQMLLVTFTRIATGELRERVRERLVDVEQALARTLAGAPSTSQDEIIGLLTDGPREQLQLRHGRMRRAVADFDAATIATTHGFCQEVLGGLGMVAGSEEDLRFEEDLGDLLTEIVDDLYVRRFHRHGAAAFDRAQALSIAKVAVANPRTRIEPLTAPEGSIAAMRRRLAIAVLEEFESRKRRSGVIGYDDLLTRLDDTLSGAGGPAAAARLRDRYRVVLVDEFQDTDPIQWDIVRRAFGQAPSTLVLIGDPKQAVYAFRGADVYAYLDAASTAATRATLEVNWRSDAALIDALDRMFVGARLGHEGIVYRRVRAAEAHQSSRLTGAPAPAPLRVRVVARDGAEVPTTPGGYARNSSAREHIAADLAADVVALLSSQATLAAEPKQPRRVRPGDIAVLVRTHRHAELIQRALEEAAVPAVINGAGSVFGTVSARDWLRLLEALERPTSSSRAHSLALTPFLGWSARQVACAQESEWEQVHRRLHHWARVLRVNGVAALSEAVSMIEQMPRRLLELIGGERRLTDLRHVAQLLHGAAIAEQLGTSALTAWLGQRIAAVELEGGDEERSRRLDSDAEAIQVLTIHRSKGLEFPIVYCPYLWEPGYIPRGAQPVLFHDAGAQDARTIDVALEGSAFDAHRRQHLIEQRGEDLRLAYVALTRAQNQAILWWAGSWDSRHSPLGRLLFSRDGDGNIAAEGAFTPSDSAVLDRLGELADEAPATIAVERSTLGLSTSWSEARSEPPGLAAARFQRHLDTAWRRTSYSDITAAAYQPRVFSEPEAAPVSEEPTSSVHASRDDRPADQQVLASPLDAMPAGARIGTLIHRVMQSSDFAAPSLEVELAQQLTAALRWQPMEIGEESSVVAGLCAAIQTPLGEAFADICLRDLARGDRLDELQFELPLAGGDTPSGPLALSVIGEVLEHHCAGEDPLLGYARRLGDAALRQSLRGYLTGTIDAVVRFSDDRGATRFGVIDFKTNRLGAPEQVLDTWSYRPRALTEEMAHAHYLLQALLYTVALHRYLRWRVRDYDPARHLGGVGYLFLRGMVGPETPSIEGSRCGVYSFQPAPALVAALSDALDGDGAR